MKNNQTADEKAMTTDYKFSLEEILELQKIVSEKIYYLPKHSLTGMRWRIWYILSNKKALLLGKRDKKCNCKGNCAYGKKCCFCDEISFQCADCIKLNWRQ